MLEPLPTQVRRNENCNVSSYQIGTCRPSQGMIRAKSSTMATECTASKLQSTSKSQVSERTCQAAGHASWQVPNDIDKMKIKVKHQRAQV